MRARPPTVVCPECGHPYLNTPGGFEEHTLTGWHRGEYRRTGLRSPRQQQPRTSVATKQDLGDPLGDDVTTRSTAWTRTWSTRR